MSYKKNTKINKKQLILNETINFIKEEIDLNKFFYNSFEFLHYIKFNYKSRVLKNISKVFLSTFVIIMFVSNINLFSKEFVKGHFITNNKGCFATESVLGATSQVCNCPQNTITVAVGGIITSNCYCAPDSVSFDNIPYPAMPPTLTDKLRTHLMRYRTFLLELNTEKTKQLAQDVWDFSDAVGNNSDENFKKAEMNYMETFSSMPPAMQEKIAKWIKENKEN